jgi:hypothetical protein
MQVFYLKDYEREMIRDKHAVQLSAGELHFLNDKFVIYEFLRLCERGINYAPNLKF